MSTKGSARTTRRINTQGLARHALWRHLLQCWPACCKPGETAGLQQAGQGCKRWRHNACMANPSVEPRNKFQLSSRITSQTIPLFRRSRSIGCRISLNVTVSNRPLTLTLKLVAVTCLGEQGYGLQWLPFQSALLPPGHPARRGTATSATTKYKHVIFPVPIFKIQNNHQ